MNHRVVVPGLLTISLILLTCNVREILHPYEPVVTFQGVIGMFGSSGDNVYYPGNRQNPNTCRMVYDTVEMYFFSEDYTGGGGIRQGDQMRVKIFPSWSDTSDLIGIKQAFIRISRYTNGNETYLVNGAAYPDSAVGFQFAVQMKVEQLTGHSAGSVLLTDIRATLHRENSTSRDYEISQGRIEGTVE